MSSFHYERDHIYSLVSKFVTSQNKKVQKQTKNFAIRNLASFKYRMMVKLGEKRSHNEKLNSMLLWGIAMKEASDRVNELILDKKNQQYPVIEEEEDESN
jgi:hypothetical protein